MPVSLVYLFLLIIFLHGGLIHAILHFVMLLESG